MDENESIPPLDIGLRIRLSIMMFLQFAVWGSWFVVFYPYLTGKGFTDAQAGDLIGQHGPRRDHFDDVRRLHRRPLLFQRTDDGRAPPRRGRAALLDGRRFRLPANTACCSACHWATRCFTTRRWHSRTRSPSPTSQCDARLSRPAGARHDRLDRRRLLDRPPVQDNGRRPRREHDHDPGVGEQRTAAPGRGTVGRARRIQLAPAAHAADRQGGRCLPFVKAVDLFRDPSFAVFFTVSFAITIVLAFYYTCTSAFLESAAA